MYVIKKVENNIKCINDKAWQIADIANIDKILALNDALEIINKIAKELIKLEIIKNILL